MLAKQLTSSFLVQKRTFAASAAASGVISGEHFSKTEQVASVGRDAASNDADIGNERISDVETNTETTETKANTDASNKFLFSNDLNSHMLRTFNKAEEAATVCLQDVKTFADLERKIKTLLEESNSKNFLKKTFDAAFARLEELRASFNHQQRATPTLYGLLALLARHSLSFREMRAIFADFAEPAVVGDTTEKMRQVKSWMAVDCVGGVDGNNNNGNSNDSPIIPTMSTMTPSVLFPMFVYESLGCWSNTKINPCSLLLDIARHLEGHSVTPSMTFYNRLLLHLGRNGPEMAANATVLYQTLCDNGMADLDTKIVRMCNLSEASPAGPSETLALTTLYRDLMEAANKMTVGQRNQVHLSYLSFSLKDGRRPGVDARKVSAIKEVIALSKRNGIVDDGGAAAAPSLSPSIASVIVGAFCTGKVALPGRAIIGYGDGDVSISGSGSGDSSGNTGSDCVRNDVLSIMTELESSVMEVDDTVWNTVLVRFYSMQGDHEKVMSVLRRSPKLEGRFWNELVTIISSSFVPYPTKNLISNFVRNQLVDTAGGAVCTNSFSGANSGIISGLFKSDIPYRSAGGDLTMLLAPHATFSLIKMIMPIIELLERKERRYQISASTYTCIINILSYYKAKGDVIKDVFAHFVEKQGRKPTFNLCNAYLAALLKKDSAAAAAANYTKASSTNVFEADASIADTIQWMERERMPIKDFVKQKLNS